MSLFDYPRINFTGTCTLNPGTANNDDYSGNLSWPATGENLALIDSANVQPRTFGMSDDDFRAWIQQPQDFAAKHAANNDDPSTGAVTGKMQEVIPAEWNYYGDMSSIFKAGVTGVQFDPTTPPSKATQDALNALVDQPVTFSGNITDLNSEGSPPATQFFLTPSSCAVGSSLLGGTPNKGVCQWINFLRNVNMTADSGAGGYIYHVIEGGHKTLPGFDGPGVCGVILRYYLFARHGGASANADIASIYEKGGTNPAQLQVTGTIAPLYESEVVRSGPVGRLLTSDVPNIPTGPNDSNNLGKASTIALAPAVVWQSGNIVSIEAIGSFPEQFTGAAQEPWPDPNTFNQKFDFGAVVLQISNPVGDSSDIGALPYADTAAGNTKGWIFDFDISNNPIALSLFADPAAKMSLVSQAFGAVLTEAKYYVITETQAIYGEQNGPVDQFRSQGEATEPATFQVFHQGKQLAGGPDLPITVWGYRTTPLGYSGARQVLATNFVPGTPLSVPIDQSGTYMITLQIGDENPPPATYQEYIGGTFTTLTNRTAISLRLLPNADYSQYLSVFEDGRPPVGNDLLTFDVVYTEVLRTYDLLFPAMNKMFHLGDQATVQSNAGQILIRTDPSIWAMPTYMPITRDLSESRRTLLQAWCRKVR